jgi:hypothetical protein
MQRLQDLDVPRLTLLNLSYRLPAQPQPEPQPLFLLPPSNSARGKILNGAIGHLSLCEPKGYTGEAIRWRNHRWLDARLSE